MSVTYIPGREVSKMVKKALTEKFPGVKFSVRYESYSGGSSIDVRYIDGPPQKKVTDICQRFEGASFDGMIDLKSSKPAFTATVNGVKGTYKYGVDFVQAQREISDELRAKIRHEVEVEHGEPWNDNDYRFMDWFWRKSETTYA